MTRRARILEAIGNHGLAVEEAADRVPSDEPFEVHFRRAVGRPLPGDLVDVDDDEAVAAVHARVSEFGRGDRNGRFQPIAANLDTLLVVIAPEPAPSFDLLHRYLTAARLHDVTPLIVVHKTDLGVPDSPPFDALDELDVETFRTRLEPDRDLDGLDARLRGGIHLLAGQSGVGKSSLTNALVPGVGLETRRLSRTTGKGRHTTTTARLHALPGGGWLVDTPGVWEYGLWQMSPVDLARGFPEIRERSADCRFRNCIHLEEPGCAVRRAAEDGELPTWRYRAWRSLLKEQQRLAQRG